MLVGQVLLEGGVSVGGQLSDVVDHDHKAFVSGVDHSFEVGHPVRSTELRESAYLVVDRAESIQVRWCGERNPSVRGVGDVPDPGRWMGRVEVEDPTTKPSRTTQLYGAKSPCTTISAGSTVGRNHSTPGEAVNVSIASCSRRRS